MEAVSRTRATNIVGLQRRAKTGREGGGHRTKRRFAGSLSLADSLPARARRPHESLEEAGTLPAQRAARRAGRHVLATARVGPPGSGKHLPSAARRTAAEAETEPCPVSACCPARGPATQALARAARKAPHRLHEDAPRRVCRLLFHPLPCGGTLRWRERAGVSRHSGEAGRALTRLGDAHWQQQQGMGAAARQAGGRRRQA